MKGFILFFLSCSFLFSNVTLKIDCQDTFISKEKPEKIMEEDEFFKNVLISENGKYIALIKPNYGQLEKVIINADDLLKCKFKFYVLWKKGEPNLYFHKILSNWNEKIRWIDGIKYEQKPFLTYKIKNNGWNEIDFTEFVKDKFVILSDSQVRIVSGNAVGEFFKERAYFEIEIKEYPKYQLWDFDVKPVEGVYVTVKNGHLYYGDKRLKLWGVCRHDSRRLETVHRLKKMGFNAIRLWGPQNAYDKESIKRGEFTKQKFENEPNDIDSFDRFFAELKKEGFFIWCVSLHYLKLSPELWKILLDDGSFISGGSDWKEWRDSVKELLESNKGNILRYCRYFDERLQKLYMKNAQNFLLHKNPYTGQKYAEEEAIAIFEIDNENGFLKWVLERGFDDWPLYFKNKLKEKWNEYLKEKYKITEKIISVWGKLDEGENLEKMNIELKPVFSERFKYPEKRGSDFIEFLCEMITDYNRKFEKHCRSLAPEGVGVSVIPFIYDTLFRLNNPWLYVNSLADANSFGIYFWKLTSSLTIPPALYVIDSATIEGKPNLIYEINTSRPNPYRSEDPLRVVAFASYQDWDGLFWHYWNELEGPGRNFIPDEQYLIAPLPYMTENWADGGIIHASDPVMCSSLSIAGHIFRKSLITPAKNPTIYEIGKNGIFNYDYFRGISTRKDSFSTGAKIRFNLKNEEPVRIIKGKKESDEVIYDWENGRMIIDNEKVKGYIGFWKENIYKFKDGFAIFNVSSPFITLIISSKDGKDLKETEEIFLTAVFDAKNTGFKMDMSIAREGGGFVSPREQARAIIDRGGPPVIMDRINFNIYFPFSILGRIEYYDFALRKNNEVKINGENIVEIKPEKDYYMIKIIVEKRLPPKYQIPEIEEKRKKRKEPIEEKIEGRRAYDENLWFPVNGLNWNMDYAQIHQFLRDSTLNFTSISPFVSEKKREKRIIITDFKIFDCVCDMEIIFENEYPEKISFTFKEIPSFEFILEKIEKKIGRPVELKKEGVAFKENYAIWKFKNLKVELKEFQGFISLLVQLSSDKISN